jgi:hypothetical protein
MDSVKAKRLKVGDRVVFESSVTGTVMEKNRLTVKIQWDDGQTGVTHIDDMGKIEKGET